MWVKLSALDKRHEPPPGLPEAISFESRCHGWLLQHGVVAFLSFGRRDVADGLEEPPVVEPVYPFQGRELHRLEHLDQVHRAVGGGGVEPSVGSVGAVMTMLSRI